MAAVQGYSWLSGAVGHAASSALVAAATAVASAAVAPSGGAAAAASPAPANARQQQVYVTPARDASAAKSPQPVAPAGSPWQRLWDRAVGGSARASPLGWASDSDAACELSDDDEDDDDACCGSGDGPSTPTGTASRPPRGGDATTSGGGGNGEADDAAAQKQQQKQRRLRGRRRALATTAAERGEAVRALLLWRDAGASAQALGLGLYLILAVGCLLPRAAEVVRPLSLLPGGALLALGYNLAKRPLTGLYARASGCGRDAARRSLARLEARAARRLSRAAGAVAREAGAWLRGGLWLAGRALRGRSFTATAWTVACLWLLLLVSELRIVPQAALAMAAYAALFALPWACARCRGAMDAAVYEAVALLQLLVAGCERAALLLAAGAALAGWCAAEAVGAPAVWRATACGAAAVGALVWRTVAA